MKGSDSMTEKKNESRAAPVDEERKMPSYAEIAALMEEEIQDKTLKEFLFEMPVIKASGLVGIGVLYKLLMFTFIYANAKYRHDKENKRNLRSTPNARRALDTFDCLFNGEDVSLDLVIYILTEMQLDVNSSEKRAYFDAIFSRSDEAIQIPVFRSVIKTWLSSADYAETNEKVLAGYLYGLYKSLSYLKNIELRVKSEEMVGHQDIITYDFYNKVTKELISDCCMLKDIDGEFYYLESHEFMQDHKKVKLSYTLLNGKRKYISLISKSDFFSKALMKGSNNISAPKSVFGKSLYALDFKYIKNLALAVSDVITLETKRKINAHYSSKYTDVFELGYKGFNEINWDNVLTILMFEEGPSNLLEFVLDSDGFCYDKILRNLSIRYNDPEFQDRARAFYTQEQSREMEALNNHIEVNTSFVKNIIEINKILMAKSIVNELSTMERRQKVSNACFVESLPMRIKNMNDAINASDSVFDRVLAINRVLEKTFRYVLPFYYGLIEYTKTKNKLASELNHQDMSPEEYEIVKKKVFFECERSFKKAAADKATVLARKSLGELIQEFRRFAEMLYEKKGHLLDVTQEGKCLYDAIGRHYFCSMKTFKEILKIDTSGMLEAYAKADYSIVSYINDVKHSKKGGAVTNVILFNQFLLKIKELFYFLIYNEDYQSEMMLGQQVSYDPIYPYVVLYEEKSERRDRCNINSFSVYLTEESGKREIKILSDREYVINEKYYCIPNVTTSNSRWWIEPFLISCREYDQIIIDALDGKKKQDTDDET